MNETNSTFSFSNYGSIVTRLLSGYRQMNLWLTVTVLVPGFLANSFMGAVFLRKRFWRRSSSSIGFFYVMYPWLSNTAIIVAILNFLPNYFSKDLSTISLEWCRTIWFLRIWVLTSCEYFQLQMTIDRALHIMYPRRFVWLSRPLNQALITCFIYTTFAVYSASIESFRYLSYFNLSRTNGTSVIVASCTFSSRLLAAHNLILLFLRCICMAGIFLANGLMLVAVYKSRQRVINQAAPSCSISTREYAFATSVMLANTIKLVLVTPCLVMLGIQLIYSFDPQASPSYKAYIDVLYSVFNWGNYLNEVRSHYFSIF